MKKLVSILIFLVLATNTSCLKKQNLEEEDLGPAITPQSLEEAMLEGFGSLNYGAIAANEYSSYVLTQKIQDSFLDTVEQQDITIKTSTDTPQSLSMQLILTKIKYSGGQSSQSTREWSETFEKSPSQTNVQNLKTLTENDPPKFLFIDFQSLAFGSCYDEGKYPQSCHNLSVTDFKFQVPYGAMAAHDCTSYENCFINARKIEFDAIYKFVIDKDGKPRRVHYTVILSKEVPYLSRVLKFCSRALYEMSSSNQKIVADLCYNVNNYAFGGN